MRIDIDSETIGAFCRKWQIVEISLFGSALRDDFRPDSDLDLIVAFAADTRWTLLDLAQMQEELEGIFGRPVDLLTRRGVEMSRNPVRKAHILSTAEVIYAA